MSYRLRPNVRQMTPYSPGKPIEEVKRELGLTDVVKLASNENPLGPSPKAIAATKLAAEEMHLYPDAAAYALRQAISSKHGINPEQVLLGNGSDELLHLLGLVFLQGPEDEIIVGEPSFVRYDAAAQIAGAKLTKIPLDAELKHDLSSMIRAISASTRIVFVANPNNPTGTIVQDADLRALIGKLPDGAILVLDEAYFEFAEGAPGYSNSLNLVKEGLPVVGLRTFSKAYGLAGIRIGYGFAPAEIVDGINRAREPFNVNSLAQAAAIGALSDDDHIRKTVANNREQLAKMNAAFIKIGAKPIKSFANFAFADLGQPAKPIFEALLRQGVIVRSGHVLGMPNTLRVSVGTEEETDRFIVALEAVMRQGVPA